MIELEGVPEMVDPVLIAAFEGWNDAGDAATAAVEHLERTWSASLLAMLDPEDYYDYQVNRPTISLAEDGTREIAWPTTRVSYVRLPEIGRDIVLVRGIEPNMRWQSFAAELLDFCHELGVSLVVTLGALLADSPHTRPVPVTGTASHDAVSRALHLEPSRYEGPTGIVGVLQDACGHTDLPAVSIWAAVPHYVAQPPCPKATLALLRHVGNLLEMPIPLGDLPEESLAWEHGVDALAAGDEDVAGYVRSLEEAKDEAEAAARAEAQGLADAAALAEAPEASGEAIAREFERYLRRRADDGPTA